MSNKMSKQLKKKRIAPSTFPITESLVKISTPSTWNPSQKISLISYKC